MNRRHFLEFSASFCATLGISQLNLFGQGIRQHQALAQPTHRKLALLVGINNYPQGVSALRGCITDAEMQRALLIHRYGFNPKDIVVLRDDVPGHEPTRDNILKAFEEHLIQQVKPGDVALFHFSGHGGKIKDPAPIPGSNGITGTLLPLDARLDTKNGIIDDITGKTLYLLSRQVNTPHFTTVLDSCYSGGTRGNVVYRTAGRRAGVCPLRVSGRELTYQADFMSRYGIDPRVLAEERAQGIGWGMALGSAQANQTAIDAWFSDFYAGAFTYLLTRYLWQLPGPEPVGRSFGKLALSTKDFAMSYLNVQEPTFTVPGQSQNEQKPIYFLGGTGGAQSPISPAAEGVIQTVEGARATFWLGGVSSKVLDSFTTGALFNVLDHQGQVIGEIEQTERQGLVGQGIVRPQVGKRLEPGLLLQEQIRGVPTNLKLRLSLDDSLEKEREAIADVIQTFSRVELVAKGQDATSSLTLTRLTSAIQKQAREQNIEIRAPMGSIGLFTSGGHPVEDSFSRGIYKSMQGALAHLRPRLKMLLAGQILGAISNGTSSNLDVVMEVRKRGGEALVRRGSRGAGAKIQEITQPLVANTAVEIAIVNNEIRNLYLGIVVVSSSGELSVIHPLNWESPESAALVPGLQTVIAPEIGAEPFTVYPPAGFFELLVLISREPLRDTLKALQQVASSRSLSRGYLTFAQTVQRGANETEDAPVLAMDSLLGDLTRMSRSTGPQPAGTGLVDVTKLAAFSTVLEVVE